MTSCIASTHHVARARFKGHVPVNIYDPPEAASIARKRGCLHSALWALHSLCIAIGMSHRSHQSPFSLGCIVRTSRALKQEKYGEAWRSMEKHGEVNKSVQGRSCSCQYGSPVQLMIFCQALNNFLHSSCGHETQPWYSYHLPHLELRKSTLEPCP